MNLQNHPHAQSSSRQSVVSTKSCILSLASNQRKLSRNNFADSYEDFCHLHQTNPLQIVKKHLNRGVVDFLADNVKIDEWPAILSALRVDQTLRRVAIRLSQRIVTPILTADAKVKACNIGNCPVVVTQFLLNRLSEALKNCVSQSPALTVLELEGLPLKPEFLALLAQGILETKSLKHLNLSKCGIGDEGAAEIAIAVRSAPTIISLNLPYCDLTHVGAMALAKLISYKKLNRETWKHGDPDPLPGLRRLSLNHNPEIGDKGVQILVNEAKDDIWLRAVDLQNTGLTDVGGRHLVHLVRNNPNLSVVDARNNPGMSENCLSKVMAILAINNADKTGSKYKWLSCQAAEGDCKKTISRSFIPRLETSIPKLKKESTFLVSKSGKGFTATRGVVENSLVDENKFLLQQIEELNRILGSEITLKAEIMQKNCCLIGALEHCQLEKKEMEQRLVKMEEIVRQLTEECDCGGKKAGSLRNRRASNMILKRR